MSRHKPPQSGRRPRRGARSPQPESQTWLYGAHTALAVLGNPARRWSRVLVCDRAMGERIAGSLAAERQASVELVARDVLDATLPEGAVHQGIAVLAAPLAPVPIEDICQTQNSGPAPPIVVLDHVTDPHNIGAIVRTAAAFQAKAVVVHDRHTPAVTGVLAKAASGGLEHCPIVRVTNLARALETLKRAGVWCIGLDGSAARALSEAKVPGPTALVLGAEGGGLRRLTRESCDALARIPYAGPVASLNVSNAAAIALYEIARSAPPTAA